MKLEYTELPTMLDVAQAQERGEKIEFAAHGGVWMPWGEGTWNNGWQYRSVREVPVKKVKVLAFRNKRGAIGHAVEGSDEHTAYEHGGAWTRFRAADVEYEVEE